MSIKIAVITDLHYSSIPNPFIPERCGEFADTLLLRAIHRFNRYIKPDIVLIGGDLINDSTTQDAESLTKNLYDIIKLLKMPFIAIPGNHDLKNHDFYNIFPRPERFTDIGNTRFVAFDDPEMPGYNAIRQTDDIETMRAARADWNGPIVALQHVPLVPPDACRYNYENAPELLKVMADCHYTASISGHLHGGLPTIEHHGVALITAQATCEAPFPYQIIEIADDGIITNKTETLALDSTLNLTDSHVHTSLAYCNENMSIPKINRLAELFGLKQTVITEHSAHLYFDRPSYSAKDFYNKGVEAQTVPSRIPDYFSMYQELAGANNILGMEIDFDRHGKPVIEEQHWSKLKFRNGAIHYMASISTDDASESEIDAEFLFMVESALKSGIDALAHPFRIFRRRNLPPPARLFQPTMELLKKHQVAAEINYHTNEPPLEFFQMCVNNGVKLTLGSDSHNLYEVGEFYPHLKLLNDIAPGIAPSKLLLEIKNED